MELRLYFKQLRQTYSFTACLYSASSKSELSDPLFLMTSFFPYFNDASISESILKCQYLTSAMDVPTSRWYYPIDLIKIYW